MQYYVLKFSKPIAHEGFMQQLSLPANLLSCFLLLIILLRVNKAITQAKTNLNKKQQTQTIQQNELSNVSLYCTSWMLDSRLVTIKTF